MQLILEHLFSTSRWGCSYHQLVDLGNDGYECICFQTCNHDTRDDVDNHTTIFFILPTIDKEFWASVARLAFGLFKLFPSVCVFHFRYWRGCLLRDENFLRISASFHVILTVSRGMRVYKTTSVPPWTRPNLSSAEIILQSSAQCKIVSPFPLLRAFAQTSARKFTIHLWSFIRLGNFYRCTRNCHATWVQVHIPKTWSQT